MKILATRKYGPTESIGAGGVVVDYTRANTALPNCLPPDWLTGERPAQDLRFTVLPVGLRWHGA